MLTASFINNNIPRLQLQDSVSKAKQLINDYKLTHLPVVAENKYLGLLSEEDLLDVEEDKLPIEAIQQYFLMAAVKEDVHFLNAVNISNQFETNVVPVLSKENDYIGVITAADLMKVMGEFSGANAIGGIIVLEMPAIQFAISEISRIVESNDCTILHMNTTLNDATGMLMVTLHINKKEIHAVVANFERYDYTIQYAFGTEQHGNTLEDNYKHLMNYLDL